MIEEKPMKMFNPPHPGLTIREDVLPDVGLSVTDAASQLGVSRVALSRVINGRAAISADMAIRFAQWLGGSAETWLRAQAQFDLWQVERGKRIKVKPVQRAAVAA
jgi:antitoxin HigA-1